MNHDYDDDHNHIPGSDDPISEDELLDMLEEAVEAGEIVRDSAGHGIAKQCILQGADSLNAEQQRVYEKYIQQSMERRGLRLLVQRRIDQAPE